VAARNKLSTKIIVMVEIILLISSILFCSVSIYIARVGIRKAIQQRMLDIANCAAGSVSGEVMKNLTEDQVGSVAYNKIYDTLAVFRDNVELEYVYCIKEAEPGRFIFTLDLDQVNPASYGDSVKYTDALAKAGKGIPAVDEVPYTDQWGEFYSAYSPVFDSSGAVVGIVVVDFSSDWFDAQLTEQTRSTVISYIIILMLSLVVAALLSFFTVRPFVRAQGKLLEEKVRAESANNAKSDFLANMSHEIRTPINAVLGMNEMIIREDNKALDLSERDPLAVQGALENISVYAGDVKKAGHNLLAIVNDILDFSKIEAGRMDIIEAPYQLSSLINDINNMILFKAQDKSLKFTVEVDPSIPDELSGDEIRIRQIITNLLNNAVKYTEKGSVSLKLRGKKQSDGALTLTIVVWDTGIGIKPEDKEILFNKFQRLEMERNSTVEGTGLGLAITQHLIELMGGTIDVESEYGKGSIFTVTIPQKIVSDNPIGDFQTRLKENLPGERPYRESFRAPDAVILVVDDTRINLTVAVNLLKNTKIKIDTAISGAEAVSMASKTRYDMIFMDQRMPEMTGTEAFHEIRNTPDGASRDVPVVCLTADAVIGAKERYLSEGFSDYLTKPIDNYALEKMLMKYLPEDKIELVTEELTDDSGESGEEMDYFATLRSVGIEPKNGLKFCQDDEAFYRVMLAEYAYGELEKAHNLQKSYESENWHDYSIYVHALKSSSKMIGASALSMRAAKLESAANSEDFGTIRTEHDSMMEEYEVMTAVIRSAIPKNAMDTDNDNVTEYSPDEDIIEFLPGSEE
jgi:signal transduction histidine kinase/ActR/RegA family two-component response regulator/HPt (histidine-containing phosphotransfer) domain-containing protein